MTRKEAQNIEDLNIEVTPLIEDAFFAFRPIDCEELDRRLERLGDNYVSGEPKTDALMKKYLHDIEVSEKALERLNESEPKKRIHAINMAFKMIDNMKTYGYPCLAWWPE